LKGCLASGFPFVFGFTCYESFEGEKVAKTGILPMPGSSEKVVGGHAVLCVGYDDKARMFTIRNSWGTSWGLKGYFKMPYSYLTNPRLASDLWTIRSVK
jgi:C1A family cysteine protease